MKYIKGEIYTSYIKGLGDDNRIFVWMCEGNKTHYSSYIFAYNCLTKCNGLEFKQNQNNNHGYTETRLSTPEEKHWLEECLRLGKGILYQEAMKTFNPSYEIY